MIGFYAIIKCSKCGNEIPVQYGYSSGLDSTIDMRPDVTCSNEECLYKFKVDFNIERHKIYNVDFDDYKSTLRFNYENLLKYIKKRCV